MSESQPAIASSEAAAPPEAAASVPTSESGVPSSDGLAKGKARRVCVWLPSSDARPPPRPDFPDAYFSPTAAEAQKAFSGQVAQRERLTDGPLLTKSLRDREEQAKKAERYQKFPLATLRVRFADRTMLEGVLPSTSTLEDVYSFVRACLTEPASAREFVLYQAPPKLEYKPTDPKMARRSLLDLSLAPSSLFYVKFFLDPFNESSRPPPLAPDLLASAKELPLPPNSTPELVHEKDDKGKSKTPSRASGGGAKVPKWLKGYRK